MLLFLGDIHGKFNYLKWYIQDYKLENCTIYQVGDFGIGFTTEFNDMNILGDLNNFLKEHNIQLYAIRGNHDNPYFFDGHLSNYFENLHLLEDYTTINVNGTKILGVGGAVSVDRRPRLREMLEASKYGKSIELHWENEIFTLNEDKLKTFENIDIVVTHTSPDFCSPINKTGFGYLVENFAKNDINLYEDLRTERDLVTKMSEILKEKNKPDFWFYGHFHNNWSENIDGVNYRLLNINEFYEYKNWKDYTPEWENDL
jgi:DNA repair exonuclease SbcCD nuclease subunit